VAGSRKLLLLAVAFVAVGCVSPGALMRGRAASVVPTGAVTAQPVPQSAPTSPGPSVSEVRQVESAVVAEAPPVVDAAVEPGPSVPSAPPPPAWDIEVAPYESHARVEYFVSRFSGAMKPTFEVALARQSRFAPMIHERLRGAGLPEDMIYLPLIESWFDPNAYSRAAAVGMWQFMTTTAKGVGMRVDWWVESARSGAPTDGAVAYSRTAQSRIGGAGGGGANGGGALARPGTRRRSRGGRETSSSRWSSSRRCAPRSRDYVPKLMRRRWWGRIRCATGEHRGGRALFTGLRSWCRR
jgi:membrane-bound lytic murein transglycosylase D